MSKIIKIIEILKNRREKGVRVFIAGSNPHSKGVVFSLSVKVFFLKKKDMAIIAVVISTIKVMNIIILFNLELFNWKLNVLFILTK